MDNFGNPSPVDPLAVKPKSPLQLAFDKRGPRASAPAPPRSVVTFDELQSRIDRANPKHSQRNNEVSMALAGLKASIEGMAKYGHNVALVDAAVGPNAAPAPEFKSYNKALTSEMRPWVEGETMFKDEVEYDAAIVDARNKGLPTPRSFIFVSEADRAAGSPKPGDMIARDPLDHGRQWLVPANRFTDNFGRPELASASNEFPKMVRKGGAERIVANATEEAEAKKEGFVFGVPPTSPLPPTIREEPPKPASKPFVPPAA